jgi:hypothetical protein
MQRILLASLMALFFGLFSMPVTQAATANGTGITSALKAISPLTNVQWRRRRRRRRCHHRRRSRLRCW